MVYTGALSEAEVQLLNNHRADIAKKLALSIAFLSICTPTPLPAQDLTAYGLAADFVAGDQVIELDVPPDLDGVSFFIVWNKQDRQHKTLAYARANRHSYELRDQPQWQGAIQVVAITLPRTTGRVKNPTFSDEIDMFLQPEQLRPPTINSIIGHTLYAWPWDAALVVIQLLVAFWLAAVRKRPIVASIVVGFLVSWALMDLRTVFDHAAVTYKVERYQRGMLPVINVKAFADQAANVIGNATWGHAPLDGVSGSYLEYRLAEHRFAPGTSDREPVFWITQDPREGHVVLRYASYYLVRKDQH